MGPLIIPGVGAGTGQPTRLDFESQNHQAQLRPGNQLDIPKQGVGQTRDRPERDGETGTTKTTGWARQDAMLDASERNARAAKGWGDFTGDRRRDGLARGAVSIDAPSFKPKDFGIGRSLMRQFADRAFEFQRASNQIRQPGQCLRMSLDRLR